MTAQPNTTETDLDAENEASHQAVAELVLLDPRSLAAHPRNIRDDLGDLEGLTASIAAVGVIEALTVVPLPDGGHRIVAGHRRCAAAILADQATVPCLLRPELAADDDDNTGHAGHVARMVGENLHREGITAIEEARAYQTMLELGVSRADIARQTGQPKKRVLKALGVVRAGAELGESLQAANLNLDQAAAVALYAEDPEVTAELIAAAAQGGGAFAHAVSRAKQDRAEQRKVAAVIKALTEAGVTVIDRPDHTSPAAQLHQLSHDRRALDEESHKSCPGHAAYVQTSWRGDVDVHHVCTDPAGHGHADRYANSRPTTGTAGGPMSDEQKAERKALIESNKAMRAANETRRAFVRDYLNRRTAPKGALRYALETMLAQRWALARWSTVWPTRSNPRSVRRWASPPGRSAMPGSPWPCWPKSPGRSNLASTLSRGATQMPRSRSGSGSSSARVTSWPTSNSTSWTRCRDRLHPLTTKPTSSPSSTPRHARALLVKERPRCHSSSSHSASCTPSWPNPDAATRSRASPPARIASRTSLARPRAPRRSARAPPASRRRVAHSRRFSPGLDRTTCRGAIS